MRAWLWRADHPLATAARPAGGAAHAGGTATPLSALKRSTDRALRLAHRLLLAWLAVGGGWAAACSPLVEASPAEDAAVFRPHSTAFLHCEVSEASYREVVGNWLRNRPAAAPRLRSLFLGRAMSFPWISRHLADAALHSAAWDARRGKARRSGSENGVVAGLLSSEAFRARLGAPLAGSSYVVRAVSVEKVLVGPAHALSSDPTAVRRRVPYDAMLWLQIGERPPD